MSTNPITFKFQSNKIKAPLNLYILKEGSYTMPNPYHMPPDTHFNTIFVVQSQYHSVKFNEKPFQSKNWQSSLY